MDGALPSDKMSLTSVYSSICRWSYLELSGGALLLFLFPIHASATLKEAIDAIQDLSDKADQSDKARPEEGDEELASSPQTGKKFICTWLFACRTF
jgi:hypothetical protein